jgi:branched-subunit amino acid aminotransferase/4-amino-4-deoxychorismate lyase
MIWSAGRVMADETLCISAVDRTFEHGLGLFESLRTWNGRACLLSRHCKRMMASARALGLPLDAKQLPDQGAVEMLREASGRAGDTLLRLVLSGGLSAAHGSVLWMRALPLPPSIPEHGVAVGGPLAIDAVPELARHKTLNYWSKRLAHEQAEAAGIFDMLLATSDGTVWEAGKANLFGVVHGTLVTPPLTGPLLPGILREVVLEQARRLGIEVLEATLRLEDIEEAFLTNSVRGVIPVSSLAGRALQAPGAITARLRQSVHMWLERGGDAG